MNGGNMKLIYLLLVLMSVFGLVYLVTQVQKASEAQQAALISALKEYDGKINASFVSNIPEIGAVTAGTVSADGKSVTLSFMPNDIAYGRNERLVYFVITIDGKVADITVKGDRVSTAIDLGVQSDSPGIVYTDPNDLKDTVASLASTIDVDKDGDFKFEIPIDTYNIDVEKIYVGLKFALLSEPTATSVSATKIYDIRVEADKADSANDEALLEVYAQYNITT